MSWPEIFFITFTSIGVFIFCVPLVFRFVQFVNRQREASWFKIPQGFRTGGYTGTPWYDTQEHRGTELAWLTVGADYRGDLLSRGLCSMEYMVGRAGNMAMHYLVRGSRPEGRYSAEFSATFERLERHHSHLDVILDLLPRYIRESPASTSASDTLSALQHDRSYRGEARMPILPILLSSLEGTREPTEPKEEPENHNKPRRLRVRKTK